MLRNHRRTLIEARYHATRATLFVACISAAHLSTLALGAAMGWV